MDDIDTKAYTSSTRVSHQVAEKPSQNSMWLSARMNGIIKES